MSRTIKDYVTLALKGMAMGAADVVPGVSGGTIAFIVGIYDELINSIKSINAHSLKLLFTGKIVSFWKAINGSFLFSILFGSCVLVVLFVGCGFAGARPPRGVLRQRLWCLSII